MKTLAQLKRDIEVGTDILCTRILATNGQEEELSERMRKLRQVSYKDTTGFYLRMLSDETRGSFCEWPKARELHYEGDSFIITDKFGLRHYQIIK
jgi:hypothetical protein